MADEKQEMLEEKVESSLKDVALGSLLSSGIGLFVGILTRAGCGNRAYTLPGGALAAGIMTSFFLKSRPLGYLVNIASCEAGYYAGVYATEYALNAVQ